MPGNEKPEPSELYLGIRRQALGFTAEIFGVQAATGSPQPYGILMETGYPNGVVTLAAFVNGDASLQFSEVREVIALRTYADLGKNPFILQLGLGGHLPWRHYLGLWEGDPVAISTIFHAAGVVGLNYVTTVVEMRRRGIGSAMCWHALHEARSHGHRFAILVASNLGEGIYRKLGFQEYCKISRYRWSP